MKIKLSNVRLSFPNIFKAKSFDGDAPPNFNASFLMAPNHPAVKELHEAFEVVGKEKWGAKWPTVKKYLESQDRFALHDGDLKAEYEGFEGNLYVNASNKSRPLILDQDKSPLAEEDGKPYGGCYVNASVDLWAMDNNYGKRICASLRGVQFVKDGEPFSGGGAASEDEFDDITEGTYAEDLV
jgi:hypothetical protein